MNRIRLVFTLLLCALLPCILAVQELSRDEKDHAWQLVAEHTRANYHKQLNAMRTHSDAIKALKQKIGSARKRNYLPKGQRYTLKEKAQRRKWTLQLKREGVRFNEQSYNAGVEFHTNHAIFGAVKNVKAAEETTAHKALRLVGKALLSNVSPRLEQQFKDHHTASEELRGKMSSEENPRVRKQLQKQYKKRHAQMAKLEPLVRNRYSTDVLLDHTIKGIVGEMDSDSKGKLSAGSKG